MKLVLGALHQATRPPILSLFAVVHALLVAALGVFYLARLDGPLSAERDRVVTGDYLVFLTGATLLAEGQGASLYDLALQHRVQNRLVGLELDRWQPYDYPPLLALVVRPLVGLPYVRGFQLYCLAMSLAGIVGALALVSLVPGIARRPRDALTIGLLSLAFHPIARTTFGGQNTVLTWALLTGSLWAAVGDRQIVAGLLVGLLSYKPQYAAPVLHALVVGRAWKAVGVACVAAVAHYAVGAWMISWKWPLQMLQALHVLRAQGMYSPEWAASLGAHFSLIAFFDFVVGGTAATALASLAILAMFAALVRFAPRAGPRDAEFPLLWSLLVVGGMLASPHLLYYEFGIVVLPVVVGVETLVRRGRQVNLPLRLALAVLYVGYPWFCDLTVACGFPPLTLWTVALFAWLCSLAQRRDLKNSIAARVNDSSYS